MGPSVRILVAVGENDGKDVSPFMVIPEFREMRHEPERLLEVVLVGGAHSDWAVRLAESNGYLVTVVPGQWSPARALAYFAGTARQLYLLPSSLGWPGVDASAQGYEPHSYSREAMQWLPAGAQQ
jgi:hypothetical protein